MNFEKLLSPINIGTCEIKNRFVMPPMDSALPNTDGTVSQRMIDYYEARAKGGFGLIIVEYCHVELEGKPHFNSISGFDDKFIPGLADLASAIHKHNGAKTFLQLHHVGRQGDPVVFSGDNMYAPSAVPDYLRDKYPVTALSTERVYGLVEKFGDTAVRAKKAGYDGVEIHGGHGYLVSEFMTGLVNKRTDEFGGDFRGRMLFPELIIKNIKAKCGEDFPVTMRISATEPLPGGREIEESRAVAKYLEKCGLDGLNISIGMNGAHKWVIVPNQIACGYNIGNAEAIKKSVSIPVIGGGRINDPYMAEGILEDGRADMLYFGRGCLADPDLPNKIAANTPEDVIPCVGCVQRCQSHLAKPEIGISCMMNPLTGKEGMWKKKPAETPKKIAVVGAGPAGLTFAKHAAERGHMVTVFEKESQAGGQFKIAAVPPYKHELGRATKYMIHAALKSGAEIKYNTEATKEMLLAGKYDTVILATGGTPILPLIKGIDGPNVVLASNLLSGKSLLPSGNILVIGGGEVGVETADYLATRPGKNVTIVEMAPAVASTLYFTQREFLMERLNQYGVKILTNTKVQEFVEDGAICEQNGEALNLTGYNSIVLAMGSKAYNPLEAELKEAVNEVHVIGDALKARSALEAIEEATKLALEI